MHRDRVVSDVFSLFCLCFDKKSWSYLFYHNMQVPSGVKHEGSLLCGRVYMIVVLELSQWKQFVPVILPLIDKEAEIFFQLLVDPLCLSVTLQMVGRSGSQLYAQEAVELSCQLRYELRTSVRNNLFQKSVQLPDVCEE